MKKLTVRHFAERRLTVDRDPSTGNPMGQTERKLFFITDHIGSVVAITDDEGKVIWGDNYTPFGSMAGEYGIELEEEGFFTGKQMDPDTGLYYFNARWYDPELGRFISEDPIRDGLNWFVYCSNNPLTFTDPTGLEVSDLEHDGNRKMTDLRWASKPLSDDGTWTYGNSGCVVTATARAINEMTFKDITPQHVGDYFTNSNGDMSESSRNEVLQFYTNNPNAEWRTTSNTENNPTAVSNKLMELEKSDTSFMAIGGTIIQTPDGPAYHEVNITGVNIADNSYLRAQGFDVPDKIASIEVNGTSQGDTARNYTLDSSQFNQINSITYTEKVQHE